MKNEMTEFLFSQFILKIDKFINSAQDGGNDQLALDLKSFKEEILSYSKNMPGETDK